MKTMKIELTIDHKKIIIDVVNESSIYSTFYDGMKLITGLSTVEEAVIYAKKFLEKHNKLDANFLLDN